MKLMKPLSSQFKICISPTDLVGMKFHIFMWAGFSHVSTCKGAVQGHLKGDGSDNYKCPE